MKKILWGILGAVLILSSSCIFGKSPIRVMSYRDGRVYLNNKQFYTVGELPSTWKRFRTGTRSISFYNEGVGATIATDAFCGSVFEDLPLATLTSNLLGGLDKFEIVSKNEFMLDGRGALRTVARGRMDGVPEIYDVVVMKKNRCNIDFISISPEGRRAEISGDFENFFGGLKYE